MAIRGVVPAILLLVATALFLHHSAQAQVTFSRDWTAGKRSLGVGGLECGAHVKSTVALCQMLVNELRQLSSCEMRAQLLGHDDDALDSSQGFPSTGRSGR